MINSKALQNRWGTCPTGGSPAATHWLLWLHSLLCPRVWGMRITAERALEKGHCSPQLTRKGNPSVTRVGLFKLSWLFPLSMCSGKGFKFGSENPKILGEAEMKTSLHFLCIPPKACFCCSSWCVGVCNQNVKNSLLFMVGVFFTFLLSYWKQKNCAFVFCRGQYFLQQQELLLIVHIIKAGAHEHFRAAVGEPCSCFLTRWRELFDHSTM